MDFKGEERMVVVRVIILVMGRKRSKGDDERFWRKK